MKESPPFVPHLNLRHDTPRDEWPFELVCRKCRRHLTRARLDPDTGSAQVSVKLAGPESFKVPGTDRRLNASRPHLRAYHSSPMSDSDQRFTFRCHTKCGANPTLRGESLAAKLSKAAARRHSKVYI